jgi:hypothetical protein
MTFPFELEEEVPFELELNGDLLNPLRDHKRKIG